MKFERAHQNKLTFVPKCFAHIQYLQNLIGFVLAETNSIPVKSMLI